MIILRKRFLRNTILSILLLSSSIYLYSLDIQAHRGGRDLLPENTLSAFRNAAALGVTTLELDTAMTADGIIVISHDPYLANKLVRDSDGKYVGEYPKLFIKDLSLAELWTYRVGKIKPYTSYAKSHKNQKSVLTEHIPTLTELFELMDELGNDSIRYNIEIKTYPEFPEHTHDITMISEALLQVIENYGKAEYCTIQSFDWRSLTFIKEHAPDIEIACLVSENLKFEGTTFNLRLGKSGPSPWLDGYDADEFSTTADLVSTFGADIISPYYKDITEADISRAHALGLKVIPWTVNKTDLMKQYISWGVDGLITDRPDLLLKLIDQ